MPFFQDGPAGLLAAIGLLIITCTLLLRVFRRLGRRKKNQPALILSQRTTRPFDSSGQQRPREMQGWEVQMTDLARDLSAQLDSKMGALHHLIREADLASVRLEQLLAESDRRAAQGTGIAD
jgi:hypothetical protein